MTTTAVDLHAIEAERRRAPLVGPVRDALAVTGRNLIAYRRIPQLLVFSTIQPVIFVLMFRYVFGGAIKIPTYVNYLLPGVGAQTVTFGSMAAAIGLAAGLQAGLMERFRSLPMARSAVLAGRTLADLTRNVFVVVLMAIVGYLVGFRVTTSALGFVAGMLLILAFGYALAWVFATVGLAVGDPETAQAAAFPVLAPLVFASSAFVRVDQMPGWLQPFANHQPVSVTASAARALMGHYGPAAWYVIQSLAWDAAILLVFFTIAVRLYRRAV